MRGQKKRRQRILEEAVAVDGFDLRWEVRSEPQWSTEDGYQGLSITVQRTDGTFRELILQYPSPQKKKTVVEGRTFLMPSGFPVRPKISAKTVEADIRQAIAAGWNPNSRGKVFVFLVPSNPD
jgi:hypothetical protein